MEPNEAKKLKKFDIVDLMHDGEGILPCVVTGPGVDLRSIVGDIDGIATYTIVFELMTPEGMLLYISNQMFQATKVDIREQEHLAAVYVTRFNERMSPDGGVVVSSRKKEKAPPRKPAPWGAFPMTRGILGGMLVGFCHLRIDSTTRKPTTLMPFKKYSSIRNAVAKLLGFQPQVNYHEETYRSDPVWRLASGAIMGAYRKTYPLPDDTYIDDSELESFCTMMITEMDKAMSV